MNLKAKRTLQITY